MSEFVELARGLLSLEVNTVVKDGVSAQKMPTPADALIDVAQNYYVFLCQRTDLFGERDRPLAGWAAAVSATIDWGKVPFPGGDARHVTAFAGQTLPGIGMGSATVPYEQGGPPGTALQVFDLFREVASWMLEMRARLRAVARAADGATLYGVAPADMPAARAAAADLTGDDDGVLARIQRTSDQIKDVLAKRGLATLVLKRGTAAEGRQMAGITSADLLTLRKAWDIGTEVIVMQTVVQIDGDMLSRVQRGWDTPGRATVLSIHKEAVTSGLQHWQSLISALAQFAGKGVDRLFGGSG